VSGQAKIPPASHQASQPHSNFSPTRSNLCSTRPTELALASHKLKKCIPRQIMTVLCILDTMPKRKECYEHSEKARAPHTHGPRDVPRCGALSLLQQPLHYKGGSAEIVPSFCVVGLGPVVVPLPAPAFNSKGTWPWCSGHCSRRRSLCIAGT
jgi:hypothetical protein